MSVLVGREVKEGLELLSQQEGVTLFMTLLAAWKVLLYRYTGQEDIVVGTPVAGRERKEVEGLIGFFVNTVVLRSDLGGDPGFRELLGRVRAGVLEGFAHQEAPFEKVVEVLGVGRDRSRSAVFDVLFAFQHAAEDGELDLGGVHLTGELPEQTVARFDLELNVVEQEQEQGLELGLIYCRDLYGEERMERMVDHYVNVLQAVLTDRDKRIGELELLGEEERVRLGAYSVGGAGLWGGRYSWRRALVSRLREGGAAVALRYRDRVLSYGEVEGKVAANGRYRRRSGG